MRFMQIESVLQTINRSEPAKNRFSVALVPCKRNSLYNFIAVFIQLCTSFCPSFEDVHVVWI